MPLFDESVLEQAIIDKFNIEGYEYISGDNLHRELTDVLIEEDTKSFLSTKYAAEGITASEIDTIVRSLRYASALPVYRFKRSSVIFRIILDLLFAKVSII